MSVGTITYPPAGASYGQKWPVDTRGMSARTLFTYQGATSYATGGDALAAGQIKLGTIEYLPPAVAIAATGAATAIVFVYNYVTGKLQAFWQTGAAAAAALPEVTAGTDISDYTALMVAEGRG